MEGVSAIKTAMRIVHQWDNYDKFRVIPEEGTDDPPGVQVSRALVEAYNALQQVRNVLTLEYNVRIFDVNFPYVNDAIETIERYT